MTLPKTIDNDVFGTDVSFGFDTAVTIATEAIDRLHTTATSHHRLIVCEVMGHRAGWLALQSGHRRRRRRDPHPRTALRPGEDRRVPAGRRRHGKRFSIIAVAEGALSRGGRGPAAEAAKDKARSKERKERTRNKKAKDADRPEPADERREGKAVDAYRRRPAPQRAAAARRDHGLPRGAGAHGSRLARHLQALTGVEARVTTLGHVQRGGVPTAFDRTLSTILGAKAAELLAEGTTT